MASNLLKIHTQPTKLHYSTLSFPRPEIPHQFFVTSRLTHSASVTRILDIPFYSWSHLHHKNVLSKHKLPLFSIHCSLSPPTPPTSKEEAILQAKTSLSTALQKPLNNPRLPDRYKKQKQPRFRVEIPVIDDSPDSLTQLALEVFGDLQIKRKGPTVKILLIWANPTTMASGVKAFENATFGQFEHIELTTVMTVDNRILNSVDVAVFLAPSSSQLTVMKLVSEGTNPSPLVLFNPKWAFEEESSFGNMRGFVGSFDVIYAFLGLEVRGILSKRKGVVFKYAKDGVVSSEKWNVFVEEEGEANQLKVVSRFKSRPSIGEVENVLYNLMAVNSPLTKSAKFLRELVSNVTGKKTS